MSEPMPRLRWPSLRAPVDILFLICCVLLIGDVLVPELWGNGKTKDYPLWYWAGQQVLLGQDLYPHNLADYFAFLYPPFPAVLLAIPAWFGKVVLYTCLGLLNVVAWWITAQLSHAMTGSGREPNQWLYFLPGFVTISFVFDMFDLGQPNLMLLALMLYGFWLLQHARPWLGGSMFALATAIKVFPVAVLPYLVWRRQWWAAVSMIVFTLVFLFVVPAPVRGFQHNVAELKTWYRGMVGTSSEKGFGQRDEQNWSWVNQSIIAVTHRLTRPVNYNQDDPSKPVRTMNVVDISFQEANLVVLAVSLALGLGFLAVMPARKRRTPRSDAEELGILFCLMTVASPLARQYYFIWLFFPMTILMHRAAYDSRPRVRLWTWLALALSGILLLLSLPPFPKDIQAWGNNLAATAVMAGALVWHILHPPLQEAASSPGTTELKPAQQSA
ncbi:MULTISPECIES: glycosyltransferase family 87 protein [unclassified Bradyrhizobium]|uniref:glycosyltransferase family 87 protein n=1 Tax=unclassified Bradyrhizobium TaxID=2631580 RepID=UPI0028E4DDDF|nr:MULTISPECIES: glycosyltransferase family 87 protein [unclassified Bradyrhizobium]